MRPSVATADLQVLGHILDTGCAHDLHGTDSGVDLAPERAGSACSNFFVCSLSEQTNKQLLYSERDTRRTFGGQGRPHFFYHCVALVVVTIYTNIQISVGWLFFGFEEV